jgi:thioredoxin 1
MMERLAIAVALIVFGYTAYCMAQTWLLWQAAKNAPSDPLLATRRRVTTILYFTTPTCAPCKYAQRPALEKLQTAMGDTVEVIQVDATEDPDAAARWQVQTVPTTYILDASGHPKQVNHGVADFDKLQQQVMAV